MPPSPPSPSLDSGHGEESGSRPQAAHVGRAQDGGLALAQRARRAAREPRRLARARRDARPALARAPRLREDRVAPGGERDPLAPRLHPAGAPRSGEDAPAPPGP